MRNKAHKSKFSSKGSVQRQQAAGGRATEPKKKQFSGIAPTTNRAAVGKSGNAAGTKDKQAQRATANRLASQQRVAAEKLIGGRGGPPRIVSFVPLNESANPQSALQAFASACGQPDGVNQEGPVSTLCSAKHRFTTVLSPDLNEQYILDLVKVADVAVLTLDCSSAVQDTIKELNAGEAQFHDDDGASQYSGTTWFADIGLCITDTTRELIHAINAHGCPTTVVVLQGLESYDSQKKARHTARLHERYFTSVLSEQTRVIAVDSEESAGHLLRAVANIKLRGLKWREQRPYFVAQNREYNAETKQVQLSGYLRGANASASMLFHVTNFNTYAASNILAPGDPFPIVANTDDEPVGLLEEADPELQEPLLGFQPNETAYDGQEFPTEADVLQAELDARRTKMVPEGVSEYQAAWYDDEVEQDAGVKVAGSGAEHMEGGGTRGMHVVDTRTDVSAQTGDAALLRAEDVLRHEHLSPEEIEAERAQLREDCEDEERHADEVDVPYDVPARQRFSKYRAMKSFATSPWDPKENLPLDYARIFELTGYGRVRDEALLETTQCPAEIGTYITVTLCDAPPALMEAPLLICSGQLRHEQKWSVVHCHVQRSSEFQEPIKSKTPMIAHIGFRKFYCEPIYSDAVVGNRSKFARYFMPNESFRVATFFAPISYHPCPVMLYEAPSLQGIRENAPMRLALFGSVLPPNPDFLILKRAVLTGRIATIYKKVLIVKFMFFNDGDVRWFQPVDLYTRLGRHGRITKQVGTHGMFKASFNDTVFQHDMIMMSLYKRVFPKWRTVPYDLSAIPQASEPTEEEEGGPENGGAYTF